jgi:hypothetical protein
MTLIFPDAKNFDREIVIERGTDRDTDLGIRQVFGSRRGVGCGLRGRTKWLFKHSPLELSTHPSRSSRRAGQILARPFLERCRAGHTPKSCETLDHTLWAARVIRDIFLDTYTTS